MGIAAALGASVFADALFAVLQIVNFFRRLLAEGALNGAFVPLWLRLVAADALASEASGQRDNSGVRAYSASEDARERADATRPRLGSSARADGDRRAATFLQ